MVSPQKSGLMCAYLALLIPVALHSHFKSNILAILHYFCVELRLRCVDPPRFYILFLLSFILFIILVNAGLFKEDVADAIPNDKHGEFWVSEVVPESNEEEKLENEVNRVDNLSKNNSDCSGCTLMKEPNCSGLIEDGEDEDIIQFHKRVEDFIRKVQVGFLREHKSLSLV